MGSHIKIHEVQSRCDGIDRCGAFVPFSGPNFGKVIPLCASLNVLSFGYWENTPSHLVPKGPALWTQINTR